MTVARMTGSKVKEEVKQSQLFVIGHQMSLACFVVVLVKLIFTQFALGPHGATAHCVFQLTIPFSSRSGVQFSFCGTI